MKFRSITQYFFNNYWNSNPLAINNLTANAVKFLYHLHIEKVLGDRSELHLYLLQK